MDGTNGISASNSSLTNEIGVMVAAKGLRVAKEQSQALIKLLEKSAEIQQALHSPDDPRGQRLDLLA